MTMQKCPSTNRDKIVLTGESGGKATESNGVIHVIDHVLRCFPCC
jgi:uncharacterized surface protein with fasciclin (FAS1) repeats